MMAKPLSPAMLKFSLAIDVVMCLLGLAVYFRLLPPGFPLLGQLPPNMGLFLAAAFAIGIPVSLLTQKRAIPGQKKNSVIE